MVSKVSSQTVTGFVYGGGLTILALGTAGFGHGLLSPLAVVSAPLFLLNRTAGILLIVPFWTFIGYLLPRSQNARQRLLMTGLLLVHYTAAIGILWRSSIVSDDMSVWSDTAPLHALFWSCFALYVVGQIVIWLAITTSLRSIRGSN